MKKSLLTKGFQLLVLMLLTNNILNAQTLLDEKFEGTAMPTGWTLLSTTTLSLNNVNKEAFKIYPNPTNSVLNIQSQDNVLAVKIIDLAGRTTNISNFSNNKIDVSNFSNGMYFVVIKTENGLFKEKFIKK